LRGKRYHPAILTSGNVQFQKIPPHRRIGNFRGRGVKFVQFPSEDGGAPKGQQRY